MSFSIMKALTSLNTGKFLKKIWTRGDLPLTGWAEGTKLGRLWKNSRSTLTNAPVWESDSTLRNTLLGGWGRLKSWENNNDRLINLIKKRMKERVIDWLNEWTREWMNEWIYKWMNESEWLNEWKTNERTYVSTHERTNERLNWRMIGLMSERMHD